MSRVVAPPYDLISAELQEELLHRDPHNAVRLVLGKTLPGGRSDLEYTRAAQCLARWRGEGILVLEKEPSIYVVEQVFELNGEPVRRVGFVARLLLEEFGAGGVFPHEQTMAGPKADRLKLMQACRANLSQVFGIYPDPEGRADRLLREMEGTCSLYEYEDDTGVACIVKRVDDASRVQQLQQLLRDAGVCIADGHHRYESALAYRDQARPPSAPPGAAPQDFTTALLVSVADRGLVALPTHRLIRAASFNEEALLSGLQRDFQLTHVNVAGAEDLDRAFGELREEGASIGCYLRGGRLFGLHIAHEGEPPRPLQPTPDVTKLPVSILNEAVLRAHFGVDPTRKEEEDGIRYNHEAAKVYEGVESGGFDAGFLLPPLQPQLVERIARLGQRLPPKSTFFYPKMPSGVLMYPFE